MRNNRQDRPRGRFGDRRERPQMHKAVCSNCGQNCEVPFNPEGKKDVLCSECFGKSGNSANFSGRGFQRDFRRNSRGSDRQMFKATCDKCGNECELPFKPTPGKPIYCDSCFAKEGKKSNGGANFDKKFDELNTKLDKIMALLVPSVKEEIQETEVKKPAKEKKATASKTTKKKVKKVETLD